MAEDSLAVVGDPVGLKWELLSWTKGKIVGYTPKMEPTRTQREI
jgi:hypothetical protein